MIGKHANEDLDGGEEIKGSDEHPRRIYDSKLLGLIFWDSSGKITDANDFFLEMTGYTRQELKEGKIKWTDLTAPECSFPDQIFFEHMRNNDIAAPFEIECIRKDKSRFVAMLGTIENVQGKYASYIINISNSINGKKELEKKVKDQEQEIRQKTEQVNTLTKELESLSYSVSHDLRAPLRAVIGYAQMLEDDYKKLLDVNGIRILNNIVKNAKKIGGQIESILEFSRLGRKPFNPSFININKVVDEVINELPDKDRLRQWITVHELGKANADYALLKQVFNKLIENALKFSSKRKDPVIEIGLIELDNNKKTYYIKDNGVGFDMAYHEKLFGLFQRLHKQEEFEGTGVGLAIVKRIISKHGGKVWAEGRINEGATFYFTLNKN